jgi:UMF1 family MFS transporter
MTNPAYSSSTSTTSDPMEKNSPRVVNAWCSYDWANSVYNLTVTTTLFPVYYSAVTRDAFGSDLVTFLGLQIRNTVLYSYAISFSFLIIVFLSPLLSGVADFSGRKKRFMKFFTYLGSLSCIGLYFFTGHNLALGITCSILASVGYAGSLVFYNGFLPEIADAHQADRISARGFSWGYLGSVILLIINLVIISQYDLFHFDSKLAATRFSFLLVGIWWVGFAQFAFHYLKDRPTSQSMSHHVLRKGFQELRKVFKHIRDQQNTARFLLSFFFYSMGVQTVILLAPLFGESVIGLPGEKLIVTVLILQLVAIAGSQLFALIAARRGSKLALAIMLCIWALLCVAAYLLQSEVQFFIMAGFLGLVLGGTQAISRSTYSKLIPPNAHNTASYFSLYDVTEKFAIVLGTLSYGLIEQLTGSMRYSSLALITFFIIGLIVLLNSELQRKE